MASLPEQPSAPHVELAAHLIVELLRSVPGTVLWTPGNQAWAAMPVIINKNPAWLVSLPGALLCAASIWPEHFQAGRAIDLAGLVQALQSRLTLVANGSAGYVVALHDAAYGPHGEACVVVLSHSLPCMVMEPRLKPSKASSPWTPPAYMGHVARELIHPWLALAGLRPPDPTAESWADRVGRPSDLQPPLTELGERRRLVAWYRRHQLQERARLHMAARYADADRQSQYAAPPWLLDDHTPERLTQRLVPSAGDRAEQQREASAADKTLSSLLQAVRLTADVHLLAILAEPQAYTDDADTVVSAIARAVVAAKSQQTSGDVRDGSASHDDRHKRHEAGQDERMDRHEARDEPDQASPPGNPWDVQAGSADDPTMMST